VRYLKVRTLKVKRSEYANPLTQHHFQEDMSPQNKCGNLKSRIGAGSCGSLSSTVTSLMNMDAAELVFCLSSYSCVGSALETQQTATMHQTNGR